jgi:nucleoside-diphosphate-sugar epimerase
MGYTKTSKFQLITGVNGFIGRALCERLQVDGWNVRGTVRSAKEAGILPAGIDVVQTDIISPDADWSKALARVDTVVHLAARVHILRDNAKDPIADFRRMNTEGTARLAEQAANAGVRRFIFLSSIGVNGSTTRDRSFTENDMPDPDTPYAVSKFEAEQFLQTISGQSQMEIVIIRSPLVYGPGNKGNFLRLLSIVARGLPLPFASVCNQRSLIYVGNLTDAIVTCIDSPKAAGQTYLVSDKEVVSTPELIRRITDVLGKHSGCFPFPPALIRLAAKSAGKTEMIVKILDSLLIDTSKIQQELGWIPPYTLEVGLKQTVDWYLNNYKRGLKFLR